MRDPNFERYNPRRKNNNTGLVVAVSLLSLTLVLALIFGVLFYTGTIKIGKIEPHTASLAVATATPVPTFTPTPEPAPATAPPQVIVIQQPNQSQNQQPPVNNYYSTYSYPDSSNSNNGITAAAAENHVSGSLYAFVNAINTGDTSFTNTYFASGDAANQEVKSINSIRKSVSSEELISLDCGDVTIVDSTTANVVRKSTIKVVYKDGNVKNIKETYTYTVKLIDGTLKITALREGK